MWLLSPELMLLLAALFILGMETASRSQKAKRGTLYIALGGVTGALIATFTLWHSNTQVQTLQSLLPMLSCDPFALAVKAITLVSTGIVLLIFDPHLAHTQRPGERYALLLFSTLAICLLAGATSLLLIFLASNLLNIAVCVLIGHPRNDQHAVGAATRYFLYGATLSAIMLYGISWFYGLTGSTELAGIAAILKQSEVILRPVALPALILLTSGCAFLIGAVPFHRWAPDVYADVPTPVAAFLSVSPTIGGFAILIRMLSTALPTNPGNLVMDWQTLLMAIATLTMTVGNVVALGQQNIKRLLAYSVIAQVGYGLVGVVTASPQGVTAALLYLSAYALGSLGAFAAIGALSDHTASYAIEIEDYAGLGKQAPALALALMICLLSLVGIPPTAGFMGKLYLFSAAVEEGLLWLAIIGAVNSVISMACYWKIIRAIYVASPVKQKCIPSTTPSTLVIAVGMATMGILTMPVIAHPLLELLEIAAQALFR